MNSVSLSEIASSQGQERPIEAHEQGDNWTENVQYRIPGAELRRLSAVNQWRSAFHIMFEWVAILSAIWICEKYWHPVLYVLTVMWIGARQHALVILMHDGAHYRLFRGKRINDCISELFLAWPVFATTHGYRATHFSHHRYINTADDPDWMRKQNAEWQFPKNWAELAKMLLRDLLGLNTRQLLAEVADVSQTDKQATGSLATYTLTRVIYYLSILGLFLYYGGIVGLVLFWAVPLLTWFKVIYRIRSIAEHFGIDERAYALSRTTIPTLLESLFIAPKNVNFHLEHHLYPSVPFYRLPQLHRLLMRHTDYQRHAHITQTYWGVLKECCGRSR
jgi:fatty acid desaturase